jgi:SAM-dependent methyltransferase
MKRRIGDIWDAIRFRLGGGDRLSKYWDKRATDYGKRSVLNLGHGPEEFEHVTTYQKKILFPELKSQLNGTERTLLDFGCGPGRFTEDLARIIGGRAIGVDPIERLLKLAPRGDDVEYRQLHHARIPCPTSSADVVWSCLVLGCIPNQKALLCAVEEIERVLKPGGLLFLIECTDVKPTPGHVQFRSVEAYRELFSFAPLTVLSQYDDLGDTNSVMAGRKLSQAAVTADVLPLG